MGIRPSLTYPTYFWRDINFYTLMLHTLYDQACKHLFDMQAFPGSTHKRISMSHAQCTCTYMYPLYAFISDTVPWFLPNSIPSGEHNIVISTCTTVVPVLIWGTRGWNGNTAPLGDLNSINATPSVDLQSITALPPQLVKLYSMTRTSSDTHTVVL